MNRICSSAIVCGLLVLGGLAEAQSADPLPSPLRVEDVLGLVRDRRAEIVAARAGIRAAAQRPAIASALEDPMISPSIDHLPFMLEGADVSMTIEQRFPLSGLRTHRRQAAVRDDQRAAGLGE